MNLNDIKKLIELKKYIEALNRIKTIDYDKLNLLDKIYYLLYDFICTSSLFQIYRIDIKKLMLLIKENNLTDQQTFDIYFLLLKNSNNQILDFPYFLNKCRAFINKLDFKDYSTYDIIEYYMCLALRYKSINPKSAESCFLKAVRLGKKLNKDSEEKLNVLLDIYTNSLFILNNPDKYLKLKIEVCNKLCDIDFHKYCYKLLDSYMSLGTKEQDRKSSFISYIDLTKKIIQDCKQEYEIENFHYLRFIEDYYYSEKEYEVCEKVIKLELEMITNAIASKSTINNLICSYKNLENLYKIQGNEIDEMRCKIILEKLLKKS